MRYLSFLELELTCLSVWMKKYFLNYYKNVIVSNFCICYVKVNVCNDVVIKKNDI